MHRTGRALAAPAFTLGGLDAILFIAGIGENSMLVRECVRRDAGSLDAGLDVAAMYTMRRMQTIVLPHRGAQHLVTNSVFAFSRNPFCLGNTLCRSADMSASAPQSGFPA